jgi:RNA polymerase sigma-70 factor (ECF subfamily)
MHDDERLAAAAQAGDADAFGRLYDAYARRIHGYLFHRCLHRETAEDLTSVTFMKALERLAGFDARKGTFSAWLHAIAKNALADHFRAARPTADIEDIWDLLRAGGDAEVDADVRARLAEVERALAAMPAERREIVILRVWDGLAYAEIAEATGKSEAACKMAFSRAVAALKKTLPLALLVLILSKPSP